MLVLAISNNGKAKMLKIINTRKAFTDTVLPANRSIMTNNLIASDKNRDKKIDKEEMLADILARNPETLSLIADACANNNNRVVRGFITSHALSGQLAVNRGLLTEVLVPDVPTVCKALPKSTGRSDV